MLSKKNRVSTKEVEKIFKTGKILNSPVFSFRFFMSGKNEKKVSFIAPKNIAKGAVDRNRLRRLGYSVLSKYIQDFPVGLVGIFVFKKYQDNVLIIENEIKNIFSKVN